MGLFSTSQENISSLQNSRFYPTPKDQIKLEVKKYLFVFLSFLNNIIPIILTKAL